MSLRAAVLALVLAAAASTTPDEVGFSLLQTRAERVYSEKSAPARQERSEKVKEMAVEQGIFGDMLAAVQDKFGASVAAVKENVKSAAPAHVQANISAETVKANISVVKVNESQKTAAVKANKSKPEAETCFHANVEYSPRNMAGQKRTIEASLEACQQRCASVKGCAHFAWWPNGGCHVTDDAAVKGPAKHVTVGPASCGAALVAPAPEAADVPEKREEDVSDAKGEKSEPAAVVEEEKEESASPMAAKVEPTVLSEKKVPAKPAAEKKVDHVFKEVNSEFDVIREKVEAARSEGVTAYNDKKMDYVAQLQEQKRINTDVAAVSDQLSEEIDNLLTKNANLRKHAEAVQVNNSVLQGMLRELGANVSLAKELVIESLEGSKEDEEELGVLAELEAADLERATVAEHDRRFAEIADAGKEVMSLRLAKGNHASDTDDAAAELQSLLAGLEEGLAGAKQQQKEAEQMLETRFHEKLAELTQHHSKLVAKHDALEARRDSLSDLRKKLRAAVTSLEETNTRLETAHSGLVKFIGALGNV